MHDEWMRRCLYLAGFGKGLTSPNPMVGCVITGEDGRILSEGYHHQYGGPHAERIAISRVPDKGLLRRSTLYVNLEPCSHQGKTPPCADLIISSGIPEVVIGMEDPNPLVAGNGIRKLREAGVKVSSGVLEEESRWLNRRFITFHTMKRPYVILKWAQTRDGYIDKVRQPGEDARVNWITGECMKQVVHKWRSEEDAILVGGRTVVNDNPQLTVREWAGRNPVRICNDLRGVLPAQSALLDGESRTLILSPLPIASYIDDKNTRLLTLADGRDASGILAALYREGIQSVIVEGGAATLLLFLGAGLWDEARVLKGEPEFVAGIPAPVLESEAARIIVSGSDVAEIHYR